jgi:SsrA-binding protein
MSRTATHVIRPPRPAPAAAKKKDDTPVVVAENRKAAFDYHLIEHFEAGLVLLGTEVKAIREGVVNLRDSYVRIENGEAFLFKVHIGQYSHSGSSAHDPGRTRKLLLNKQELRKLIGKTTEKGMTVVPTRLYFKGGRLKVAISLAKGKKAHDKRETVKKREADRETRAAVKERVR